MQADTAIHNFRIEIPMRNIDSPTMGRVLKWIAMHWSNPLLKADAATLKAEKPKPIPAWDKKFLEDLDLDELYAVLSAAHYLDVKLLVHYAAKTIALMMKDKTPQQLARMFQIPNDFAERPVAGLMHPIDEWPMPIDEMDCE